MWRFQRKSASTYNWYLSHCTFAHISTQMRHNFKMLGLLQNHYQLCSLNLLSFVSPDWRWDANPMAETYYTPAIKTLMGNPWLLNTHPPSTSIVFVQASERYTLSDCMSRVDAKVLHYGAGLEGWLHCRQTHVLCIFNGRSSKGSVSQMVNTWEWNPCAKRWQ